MQVIFNLGCLLVGVIIGVIATVWHYFGRSDGVLKIDHSNPEKDIYRIELDDLDSISKRKRIVLKIDNYADLRKNNTSYYETK